MNVVCYNKNNVNKKLNYDNTCDQKTKKLNYNKDIFKKLRFLICKYNNLL